MTMPGLKDTLNLKFDDESLDMDIPEYFEISADVEDFELDMSMSVATTSVLDDIDTDDFSVAKLEDKMNELQSAADQLTDGTVTLQDGTQTLADSIPALTDGVGQLDDGASSLKDGIYAYTDGATALAAGAGVVALAAKNHKNNVKNEVKKAAANAPEQEYRNTERGKNEKNSKGIYYTNGNYEAFARPKKPQGVDEKSAYIVGSGLASLAAACFLVRDGQMKGSHVHILEKDPIPGGACDGYQYSDIGYVMRGGREMDNHFECMWDLFRSIPSIETEGVSVLDEYYWLNKADPNYSLCRATENRGQDAHTDKKFGLSDKGAMEIMKLFFTPDEELYNKRIDEYFDEEVLNSNFWMYWRTMFAFENWHSALEMKLYIKRFIHHKKPEDGKVSAQINDQCGFCFPRTVFVFKVLDQPPIRIIKYNRKQHD